MLIEGRIGPDEFEAFKRVADQLGRFVLIDLESPGGNMVSGLQIGEYIREKRWATLVYDECDSACAAAWLGGVLRYMSPIARIGFHAASVNGQESGVGSAVFGAYMTRLGLSYKAVIWATTASPKDIAYLTPSKARQLGIEVTVIDPDEPQQANAEPVGSPLEITPRAVTPVKPQTTDKCNDTSPAAQETLDWCRAQYSGREDDAPMACRRWNAWLNERHCPTMWPINPVSAGRDCSAISAEMTLFFPDKFEDCYNKPAAKLDHVMYSYMTTLKTWDRFIPSSGRYITRTLQVSYGSNTYRLIAKDHDADGGSNGGSLCYFKSTGWSDCETNMGEHYQLRPGSIKAFLNIANGADADAPQPPKPAPATKPKVATAPKTKPVAKPADASNEKAAN